MSLEHRSFRVSVGVGVFPAAQVGHQMAVRTCVSVLRDCHCASPSELRKAAPEQALFAVVVLVLRGSLSFLMAGRY